MMLSQETIKSIQAQIEQTELVNGWTDTMPKQKLLDFIATAKELGIIAGKL